MSSHEGNIKPWRPPDSLHPAGDSDPDERLLSPKYLWIACWVLIAASLSLLTVVMIARHDSQINDPFAEYRDIYPGQTRGVVVARGFSCQPYSKEYCTKAPRGGSFSLVSVTLSHDIVQRVKFIARQGVLTVGEMALLLGERPHVVRYRKSVTLKWAGAGITASGWAERPTFGYDLAVQSVELTLL